MRLFIGIEPPDQIRRAISNVMETMKKNIPGKYVRPDMLHITLAFPGETDEACLEIVKSAVDSASRQIFPFEVTLDKPGFFGKIENAILFCGTAPSAELTRAAEIVRNSLADRDITFDSKPFVSHITLARHARLTPDALEAPVDKLRFTARHLTLFHSHRVDGILTYSPIHRAQLSAERP